MNGRQSSSSNTVGKTIPAFGVGTGTELGRVVRDGGEQPGKGKGNAKGKAQDNGAGKTSDHVPQGTKQPKVGLTTPQVDNHKSSPTAEALNTVGWDIYSDSDSDA